MSHIGFRLLGPLAITIDGGEPPPDVLWRKNAALLVYLVCSPEHRRTREHLIGILWGEKTDAAARQSLREALRILRRALGTETVGTEFDDVSLQPADTVTDTATFLQCEVDHPSQAMQLVRGVFLEGFAVPNAPEFENWLASQRMEWGQRALDVRARVIKQELRTGNPRRASVIAMQGLHADPTSDLMVRLAMKSLALAGDRSAALRAYQAFTSELEELGVPPETETEQLRCRIQKERQWSLASQSGDPRGIRRPVLVARDSELNAALDLWSACINHSVPVLISTESDPGTGKTRLAEEVLGHARLDGALVLSVRGVAPDEIRDWIGLVCLADSGLVDAPGLASADPSAIATFVERLPEWSGRFPSGNQTPLQSLGDAMHALVHAVLDEQPVVLLLDDAHFIDTPTLDFIDTIVRDSSDKPLFIWVNTSPAHPRAEIDRLHAKIGRDIRGLHIKLAPFSTDDIQSLIDTLMQHLPEDQRKRLARRIVVDSGGIPFLAVELLYAVESGMELESIPAQWPQPEHTLTHTRPGDLPRAAVFAIRVGFRALSHMAQELLRVAAVIGEPATVVALAAGTGRSESDLDDALDELEWQHWIEADTRGYTFAARIVREVILADLITPGHRERILQRLDRAEADHSAPDASQ